MATIGKINIGVNSRKNFHDFKHDVNSTLSFGFCEPTLIHSMHAKSSIALKSSSVVRLAPLPCPTFGRMKARTDTVFVPMTDVFEAWNEFISGTAYNTANGSGVPDEVDNMTFNDFFLLLLQCGTYLSGSGLNRDTFRLENIDNILRQMCTFSFSVNWDIFADGDTLQSDNYTASEWYDLDTLMMSAATPYGKFRAIRFLSQFLDYCTSYGIHIPTSTESLQVKLGMNVYNTDRGRLFNAPPVGEGDNIFNNFPLHYFFRPSYFRNCEFADLEQLQSGILGLVHAYAGAPEVVNSVFDNPRTHANYDFSYVYEPGTILHWASKSAFDDNSDDENINSISNNAAFRVALNVHLTPYGKRVMKILNAMGVTQRYNDEIELPKLFAYYKAWFDLFDPQRTKNWKQTNVYRLVHSYYDYRVTAKSILNEGASFEGNSTPYDYISIFNNVLIDLVKCNYYLGADTITVANRYPLQPANGNIDNPKMLQGLNPILEQGYDGRQSLTTIPNGEQGAGIVNSNTTLTSLSVIALERLYYAINKESALASNIEDIMLARFGVNIKSTRILGRSDYNIEIDPIFATVNNEQTQLGEYGGKSVANGSTKQIDFTAPVQGYVIQLFSIVPYGGYVQASSPAQLKRGDFYSDFTAMYDSLGYEKLYKSQVLGRESVINNFKGDEVFGEVPQMFHLKYRNNLANGGFSFHSERASFLPYSLDRLFSEGELQNVPLALGVGFVQPNPYSNPIDVVPDTIMRTVGLYEGFGNYDRIFYDTTGLSDNFILHMIQDLKYYSPMKSISSSFDTVDKSVDDDTRQVERA